MTPLTWAMLALAPIGAWWGMRWLRAGKSWERAPEQAPEMLLLLAIGIWIAPSVIASIAASMAAPLPMAFGFGIAGLAAAGVAWKLGVRPDLIGIWRGLAALGVMLPVVSSVGIVSALLAELLGVDVPELGHQTLSRIVEGGPEAWALAGGAVVGAPLVEEVAYRLLLHGCLMVVIARADRFRSAVIVSGVVGLVFGLVHIGAASPHTIPSLVVLGWCLGMVRESLGVWPAVVAHAGFNAWNIVLALMVKAPGSGETIGCALARLV